MLVAAHDDIVANRHAAGDHERALARHRGSRGVGDANHTLESCGASYGGAAAHVQVWPTPAPPVTVKAPVVGDVALVVDSTVASPVMCVAPPTYRFSVMPAPPTTWRVPEVELEAEASAQSLVVPCTLRFSGSAVPPVTITAPVRVVEDVVESLSLRVR